MSVGAPVVPGGSDTAAPAPAPAPATEAERAPGDGAPDDGAPVHAALRCPAQDELAYRRYPISLTGVRSAANAPPKAAQKAHLEEHARKLFKTCAGGVARRGADVGDVVTYFVKSADRGYDNTYHRSRDDAVTAETQIMPAKVSCVWGGLRGGSGPFAAGSLRGVAARALLF